MKGNSTTFFKLTLCLLLFGISYIHIRQLLKHWQSQKPWRDRVVAPLLTWRFIGTSNCTLVWIKFIFICISTTYFYRHESSSPKLHIPVWAVCLPKAEGWSFYKEFSFLLAPREVLYGYRMHVYLVIQFKDAFGRITCTKQQLDANTNKRRLTEL